jgi:signal transduction histidine kinase
MPTQDPRAREWLHATLEVTRSLLSRPEAESLTTVAQAMRTVSKADFVLVILPISEQKLMLESAVGEGTDHLAGSAFARADSISDPVLSLREVVLVDDAQTHGSNAALRALSDEIDVGPMMFVPLEGQGECRGVIASGRRRGDPSFAEADVEPAVAFANHATLALELADGRRYRQRMLLLEERHRLAAELHDQVLQRLFALGLSMQSIVDEAEPVAAPRVAGLIASADDAIACIRTLIRELNGLDDSAWERTVIE